MSVLACSRTGCKNIMCDTFVPEIGYICDECKNEFKKYLQHDGKTHLTSQQIVEELKIFIETPKGTFINNSEIDVDSFLLKKYNKWE